MGREGASAQAPGAAAHAAEYPRSFRVLRRVSGPMILSMPAILTTGEGIGAVPSMHSKTPKPLRARSIHSGFLSSRLLPSVGARCCPANPEVWRLFHPLRLSEMLPAGQP